MFSSSANSTYSAFVALLLPVQRIYTSRYASFLEMSSSCSRTAPSCEHHYMYTKQGQPYVSSRHGDVFCEVDVSRGQRSAGHGARGEDTRKESWRETSSISSRHSQRTCASWTLLQWRHTAAYSPLWRRKNTLYRMISLHLSLSVSLSACLSVRLSVCSCVTTFQTLVW